MSCVRTALTALALLCGQLWLAAGVAAQSKVPVKVVEVSGRFAYVRPGAEAGIHRGDKVVLLGKTYDVVASSARSAAFDRRKARIAVGSRGTATTSPVEEGEAARRVPPRALETYRQAWPVASLPAASQHPIHVPLGAPANDTRTRAAITMRNAAIVPTSRPKDFIVDNELRGRVHYEPLDEAPWAVDADVALRIWAAQQLSQRPSSSSRPLARVRQLQTSYGGEDTWLGVVGRMPYVARTLGVLDGARAEAPLGARFTLGAFGGFVPSPLNETPDLDTTRFGVEAGYRDLEAWLRPEVALTAQASRFDGRIDERRLTGFVDVYPSDNHLGGYAELSLFDRDNPWNTPATQVTAGGAAGSLRWKPVEVGARFDMQRPERSRWLDSYLGDGLLCTHVPRQPGADEPCRGDDARYLVAADANLRSARWLLRSGVTRSWTANVSSEQLGGFLQGSVLDLVGRARLDAGVMGSTGSLLHTAAVNVSIGAPLLRDTLNLAARYRPALSHYEADTGRYLEHLAGASLGYSPEPRFTIDLDADYILGRDIDVLLVQSLITYRP